MGGRFSGERQRVVILGGGFGGAYAARELIRRRPDDVDVTLIDRNNYLLFYPLLVEAGIGAIEPRHVVAPIRTFTKGGEFRMAEIVGIDVEAQTVKFVPCGECDEEFLHYDHLLVALGSVTRTPEIPGLREHGFELKSIQDGIGLRDRAVGLLELADVTTDPDERRALLTFVVVGANFTGVEFTGEYEGFLRRAARSYPNVHQDEIQVVLLEFADRILPAVNERLAQYAQDQLTRRGISVQTSTTLTEIGPEHAVLTTGERLSTHTVVWAAGIAPNPLLSKTALPKNEKGYIPCKRDLRVEGFTNVWAVGDLATIPTSDGGTFAATAQNATRQGPLAAGNILASLAGRATETFDYSPVGSFAAIGRQRAVAEFMGRNITGMLAFMMYRATYLFKMPTFALKLRLFLDWTLGALFPLIPVQLGIHRSKR